MKPFTKLPLIILLLFLGCSKKTIDPIQNGSQNSTEKKITSNPTITGIQDALVNFDALNYVYEITVPSTTSLKALRLNIEISDGAKISPDPSSARDYTDPVVYEVTAGDGSKQKYTIFVIGKIPAAKTNCLVSRIEDVDSKEYFSFQYDANGRVVQIDSYFALSLSDRPFQALVTFQYNGSGDVSEAHFTGNASTINKEGITYKPVYSNGKLVRVAYKNQAGGEGSINTAVDSQKQLTAIEYPGNSCYSYNFFGGVLTRINTCNSVFINSSMDYSSLVRNYTTGQSTNPAFMCIYIDILNQFDPTGLLFQPGLMLPSQRTEFIRPTGAVYEKCSVSYRVNADGYPLDMQILQQKKLNSDFPYTNSLHYAISYTNCK